MRHLSSHTRELVDHLYRKPNRLGQILGQGPRPDLGVLAELAACGEPRAVLYIRPLLLSSDREEVLAGARAIDGLLSKVTPDELVWLDEMARHIFVEFDPWWRLTPHELDQRAGPGWPGSLLLQLASFHGSGYVREEAVRRLAQIEDGSELPYLLLRLNDWVHEVRKAASDAVIARIKTSYSDHFVKNLALVVRLERAERTNLNKILEAIFALLRGSEVRGALVAALHSGSRAVRRASYRALVDGAPAAEMEERLLAAFGAPDPVIRLWSIQTGLRTLTREQLSPMLERAWADRAARIRGEALAAWATESPSDSVERLNTALMDRSAIVRAQARYHLRQQGHSDFAPVYRNALATGIPKWLAVAIAGLAETGLRTDAERIAPFLHHENIGVRRTAILSVMRLDNERYMESVMQRLLDSAPGVSSQAAKSLRAHAGNLDPTRLWTLFESSSLAHVRRNLLRLMSDLPKWEGIICMVKAVATDDPASVDLALGYVRIWNERYNVTQTTPSREQLARLEAALRQAGARLGEKEGAAIRFSIRSFT